MELLQLSGGKRTPDGEKEKGNTERLELYLCENKKIAKFQFPSAINLNKQKKNNIAAIKMRNRLRLNFA